jgi:hypothetical protein
VGGFPAHAVIVAGSDIAPDDLAANYHRVGGRAAHPTGILAGANNAPGRGNNLIYITRVQLSNAAFQPQN